MLASVPAGGGSHANGSICSRRTKKHDSLVVALAALCGRPLPAIVRQLAPTDTPGSRSDNLKRDSEMRVKQLTELEAALARMTDAEQRKHRAAATAAAATAAAATAAAATAATAPTAGQRRPREDEPEEEEEELEPQGLTLSEFKKLLPIERARRNPARLLFDHPHVGGLVISISDASFTYFEWGDPEEEEEEDTTPTRWYAEVR